MSNFERLLNTTDRFYFEICKDLLAANEIEFRERNTVDSMYQNFGTYEIFVETEDLVQSKQLINIGNE